MARLIIDNNEFVDTYYQECFEQAVKEGQEKYGFVVDTECDNGGYLPDKDAYVMENFDSIEYYFDKQVSYEDKDLRKMFEAIVKTDPITEDDKYVYFMTFIMRHMPDEDEDHWYFDNESLKVERKEK